MWDAYRFAGFIPKPTVWGIFGDPKARVIRMHRRGKRTRCSVCGLIHNSWYDLRVRRVRDRSCGDTRVYEETHLDWKTVQELEKQYRQEQLRRRGMPGPRVIGIDEVSIAQGHTYRMVVSDLVRRRPIWFGGQDRSEASMDLFYAWLGPQKSHKIRLAVLDMWKPFRTSTLKPQHAPQASILFNKFHVISHLGDALDTVRKSEYARLAGRDRLFIKGQKYTLLAHRENLTRKGRQSLKLLLKANKRLNTAYLLKESFGQLWDYQSEAWARRFFENWRDALKWQRLGPYEKFAAMIDRHWDGIAAFCKND